MTLSPLNLANKNPFVIRSKLPGLLSATSIMVENQVRSEMFNSVDLFMWLKVCLVVMLLLNAILKVSDRVMVWHQST